MIVVRLVASELALRSLLALSQRPAGVRTAELAAMLDAPPGTGHARPRRPPAMLSGYVSGSI